MAADDLEDDFQVGNVEADEGADKRKRNRSKSLEPIDDDAIDVAAEQARKKQRLKDREKAKKAKKAALNLAMEPGTLTSFPPDMQLDHLRKLMLSCKQYSKLTQIELDEFGLTEKVLIDTSGISLERKGENLADFIRKSHPKACQSASNAVKDEHVCGRPVILVITGNAPRAADIARALRPLLPKEQSNSGTTTRKIAVAKLFARHFKLTEQTNFLQSHVCPTAVGTPQRLVDLLPRGLNVEHLQSIVLDASWTDVKKRTMFDTIDIRQALFDFLTCEQIRQAIERKVKPARILLF